MKKYEGQLFFFLPYAAVTLEMIELSEQDGLDTCRKSRDGLVLLRVKGDAPRCLLGWKGHSPSQGRKILRGEFWQGGIPE